MLIKQKHVYPILKISSKQKNDFKLHFDILRDLDWIIF